MLAAFEKTEEMEMKRYILVVLLSILLGAMPAFAGTYECKGTVTNLAVYGDGRIALNLSGPGATPFITVCSLTANFGNWTPDTCKAAYSMLLSAKSRGLQVVIEFNDTLGCSAQPGTGALNTNYSVYIPN
jgi:hypothetical protein